MRRRPRPPVRSPQPGDETHPSPGAEVGHDDAIAWLRAVDGELYRTGPGPGGRKAWVAVVRARRPGAAAPRTIVALGETLVEAARAAASQWRRSGADRPLLH